MEFLNYYALGENRGRLAGFELSFFEVCLHNRIDKNLFLRIVAVKPPRI
jgi:hypothetical protein